MARTNPQTRALWLKAGHDRKQKSGDRSFRRAPGRGPCDLVDEAVCQALLGENVERMD